MDERNEISTQQSADDKIHIEGMDDLLVGQREHVRTVAVRTRSASLHGVGAHAIDVEVHLVRGLPSFDVVGLPEAAVRESRVRVRAALSHVGETLPPKHVIVNLAPADLRKRGAALDLAMAAALIAATRRKTSFDFERTLFAGELSLDGCVRGVRGVLPMLLEAQRTGCTQAIVPFENAREASFVKTMDVRVVRHLSEVIEAIDDEAKLPKPSYESLDVQQAEKSSDFSDVRDQRVAKRALEIAAAGGHNLFLVGSPGVGKSMLARRLPTILPTPSEDERMHLALVASAAGQNPEHAFERRPFRAPHHSASVAAMVGGGDPITPGEVTLAHGGVLFLDEFPEFARSVLESLRTVMEMGSVEISRVRDRVQMPARPLFLAAMNPCPCGYLGDARKPCSCSASRVENYRGRISGPLLDRFDMQLSLSAVSLERICLPSDEEKSEAIRRRVDSARHRALEAGDIGREGQAREMPPDVRLQRFSPAAQTLLENAATRASMSMRSFVRVLRVATTIAHLEDRSRVETEHVAEALQYRFVDR